MVRIEVNGKELEVNNNDTILSAVRKNGIEIPTLCNMDDLKPTGACRLCVVEVEGFKPLIPSCSYPVSEGMKIQTHSARARAARKTIIELLLANHPDDCLYCDRNANCELSKLAYDYGVRNRRFTGERNHHSLDISSPSIIRDPEKCILCGKCVRVCEEIQGVAAIDFTGRGSQTKISCAFDESINVSSCVNCGQCILVCPTGALREQDHIKQVVDALNDPNKHVVFQHAPSISVTLAEEFNQSPGKDICGIMTAALRKMGADSVFDTSFSADLTIMEEASELIERIKNGGKLPMMTTCSPGWIKFVEQFYPEFIGNLSSCKSPQQMLGAVIKNYYAKKEGIDPKTIYSVGLMPCTAKKFEAERPEMKVDGVADLDAVLTTREIAKMIKRFGIDLNTLEPEAADIPFGSRSTAGKLFGATGGVMEAAIRTAYHMLTGEDMKDMKIAQLRGTDGIKEAQLKIGDLKLGVVAVSGLANARKILDQIKNGRDDIHFIEVMTCPGGCIAGGGQPINSNPEKIALRMKTLYNIDKSEKVRTSYDNIAVKELYKDFLIKPLSPLSHKLLHTEFNERNVL